MKNIAFLAKGKTFFKAIGPLVYFSNNAGVVPHLICYRERHGKEYDSVTEDLILRAIHGLKHKSVSFVNSDKELSLHLENLNIENIVCQDPQHHFRFLDRNKFRIFSIAIFSDTLHYALSNPSLCPSNTGDGWMPHKTYFSNSAVENKFHEIYGETQKRLNKEFKKWNTLSIGSPYFDHLLFFDNSMFSEKSVLFLTPPSESISDEYKNEINSLIDYCIKEKIDFFAKGRKKTHWNFDNRFSNNIIFTDDEIGFPYTSLQLLKKTSIHITAYGTSAFESNFLGKPAINMPVIKSFKGLGNYYLSKYGLDEVFNNELCQPSTGNLIKDISSSIENSKNQKRQITLEDNNSLDILRDIVSEIS
jgi:hypothetical protein